MYRILAIVLIALSATLNSASAEVMYVTDQLEVPMRSGKSTSHRITRMLDSGTEVEIVEASTPEGYSLVRAKGAEGWVLTRWLDRLPSARDRLASANQENTKLTERYSTIKSERDELSKKSRGLESERQNLLSDNTELKKELEKIRVTAGNTLSIQERNQELQKEVARLQREIQELNQKYTKLKDKNYQEWFVAGAGVLFAGIILGFIIPKLRLNKKSSWDTL